MDPSGNTNLASMTLKPQKVYVRKTQKALQRTPSY